MPTAPIDGLDLYYESHGDGPAVVFAHQRSGNHLSWWQQVPTLSAHYRCITLDLRGWGASAEPPGGPGAAAWVDDLAGLLDHLEIGSAFVVGHAMGGLVALPFALRFPDRLLGMVLSNTTGGVGDREVLDALTPLADLPAEDVPRTMTPGFVERHPDRTFLYREIAELNRDKGLHIREMLHDPEGPQAADLARLSVPTLLIMGAQDLIFPEQAMRRMEALIPGARLEIVADAAHLPNYEQPEAFNRLLDGFFREVLAAGT